MDDYKIYIGVFSLLCTQRVQKPIFSGVVPVTRKLLNHMLVEHMLEIAFDKMCLAVNS